MHEEIFVDKSIYKISTLLSFYARNMWEQIYVTKYIYNYSYKRELD